MTTLTAERLREVLDYDAETGLFRWRVSMGSRARAGQITGTTNSHGYKVIRVDKKLYGAHRLAWLHHSGEHAPDEVDHVNGDRTDNRIVNLRPASSNMNNQNVRKPRKHNTSGVLGVTWDKQRGLWAAQLTMDKKCIHFGRFADIEQARAAYLEGKRQLHEGCTI